MTRRGTSKTATSQRYKLFVLAYIGNGNNATQAAIEAGYSKKTAKSQGQRLLTVGDVQNLLKTHSRDLAAIVGLDTQRTLLEVARLAYNDPRQFFHGDGRLKDIGEWTPDMAAAVASLEVQEGWDGDGEDRRPVITKKLKLWDKNAALEKAMKHHGLYERDNSQRGANLALQVVLVGAPQADPAAKVVSPGIEVQTR